MADGRSGRSRRHCGPFERSKMLDIVQATKVFRNGTCREVHALQGVSLRVLEGEMAMVIGTRGAGVSTLLATVAGATRLDGGSIGIGGVDLGSLSVCERSRLIGWVRPGPCGAGVLGLTVAENLALAGRRGFPRPVPVLTRRRRDEMRRRLRALHLGLGGRLDQAFGSLAGEERLALSLLLAAWGRPRVLLVDQEAGPAVAAESDQLVGLARSFIAARRLTALVAARTPAQAANVGSRLIVMHRGRVVRDASGEEKQRLREADVAEILEGIRHAEGLDRAAAELLARAYL